MNDKPHILIVDDAAENRTLLRMMLDDIYLVSEAESGDICLAMINEMLPDLVLLDINMPGMSGYDVCVKLRSEKPTEHLPIIFVSVLESVEERLRGFESGADDYITKPVQAEALQDKVNNCLFKSEEVKAAKKEASDAMRIAMEAMTVTSELGQIVGFVKNVQKLKSAKAVGDAILAIAAEFNLSASVMVHSDKTEFIGCSSDSIEVRVLRSAKASSERLISVGIRTIIRNDNIVLLIKDMPKDDENRSGRLKDHLAVLMDIANGRMVSLGVELQANKQRKEILGGVIDIAEEQIKTVGDKLHNHHENSESVMAGMVSELEEMLFSLGLDEDQEKLLMQLADNATAKLQEIQKASKHLDEELAVIIECLYEFKEGEGS